MRSTLAAIVFPFALVGCGSDTTSGASSGDPEPKPTIIDGVLLPDVEAATFVSGVDHPYFPLPIGATWVYEATSDEAVEHIEIEVLAETHTIMGVKATAVQDTVTVDGEVIEDTTDWYAQDADGNVWYLGEDTCEFENGKCVSRVGAWVWGEDGAKPGIIMPANPKVDGQPYFQEYYKGEAQDIGEVVALKQSVKGPAGSFADCVKTLDTSAVDPDLKESKFYCRGVGNTRVEEPDAIEELLEYHGL